ncbi:MAG TPA: hypothetical protein VFX30_10405 [bacterium]|nr:hypothetical protein [bacterium]
MTIGSAMSPGLLSRLGPSLYSPAMLLGDPVSHFSTNTLLGAFQPSPETGKLFVPAVPDSDASTTFSIRSLDKESFSEARRTVQGLLGEADHFVKEDDLVASSRTFLLYATEGEWGVGERSGALNDNGVSFNFFHGRSRRDLHLSVKDDGGLNLYVGWRSLDVRVFQEASLDPSGVFRPGGYQFEIKSRAIQGLKSLLGLPQDLGGAEVALDVAARIYASGQYTPEESGCSLLVTGAKGRRKEIPRPNGKWSLPENMSSEEVVMVGMRGSVPHRDNPKLRMPVAGTYWEREAEHLSIRLHNLPGKSLPMEPSLRSLLWDGILGLLFNPVG